MSRRPLLLLVLLWACHAHAQHTLPDFGPAFLQEEVASVFIQMDPDSAAALFDDVDYAASHEWPATFIYQSSQGTDTLQNVGFRLRGNTSLTGEKKSFKVDFNAFESGQHFHGLQKMNLNGEKNDVSLVRSALGWHILRQMGLAGARTSHVRLYLNGEYRGLYLNTEHFDDAFVDTYIDNGNGNLYKCLWPADLAYLSPNSDDYKFEVGGRRTYELKTNTAPDNYTDLSQFIDVLNNSDQDFACAIRGEFNVPDYLKILALDVLMANWDNYAMNKNNYYLYHNQKTDNFDYLAYDLDNTFGIDWVGMEWEYTDPYNWIFESRPLYENLMDEPEFRNWYTHYIGWIQSNWFNEAYVADFVDARLDLIASAVQEDGYYPLDYGFTFADFESSATEAVGGHVQHGVVSWVNERNAGIAEFLEPLEDALIINHLRDGGFDADSIRFKVTAFSNLGAPEVTLWLDAGLGPEPYTMYDDGNHDDRLADDGLYGLVLPNNQGWESLSYQVQATVSSMERWYPCTPLELQSTPYPMVEGISLVINELMSDNVTAVFDNSSEADDWCELNNSGSVPLFLGGMYLTDDLEIPGKWALPDLTINPGDWVLFWLDEDSDQGPLHANFKLSAAGETLALMTDDSDWHIVDLVTFPALETDHSYGRASDGAADWVVFTSSTPDASNNQGGTSVSNLQTSPFIPWPNPTTDALHFSKPASGTLSDGAGRLVSTFQQASSLNLAHLAPGVFMLQTQHGLFRILKQ